MLNSRLVRTTVVIPEDLLFELKKRAVRNKKTVKELVTEGLKMYLYTSARAANMTDESNIISLFGAWGKGKSGKSTLTKLRYNKEERKREKYIDTAWKKS